MRYTIVLSVIFLTALTFILKNLNAGAQQIKAPPTVENGDFSRKLKVEGGYSLFINCTGKSRQGYPVVLLEAGHTESSSTWQKVQPEIAKFARVCSYDRAGRGKSEPAPTPRTSREIVEDLHQLLRAAKIQTPLVLVGHSLGGINAQLYAERFPKEVAGMVLIDSLHEGESEKRAALLPLELKRQFKNSDLKPMMSPEGIDILASEAQMREAKWRTDIPLVVISQGIFAADEFPVPELAEKFRQLHFEMQRDLSKRSTRGKFIIADKSGHLVHHDQPELVIAAVRQILSGSNTKRSKKQIRST